MDTLDRIRRKINERRESGSDDNEDGKTNYVWREIDVDAWMLHAADNEFDPSPENPSGYGSGEYGKGSPDTLVVTGDGVKER